MTWGNQRQRAEGVHLAYALDQLGDGTGINERSPARVRGLTNVQAISGDANATCAVKKSGEVLCWGLRGLDGLGLV